jgi:hypothetical protein
MIAHLIEKKELTGFVKLNLHDIPLSRQEFFFI